MILQFSQRAKKIPRMLVVEIECESAVQARGYRCIIRDEVFKQYGVKGEFKEIVKEGA